MVSFFLYVCDAVPISYKIPHKPINCRMWLCWRLQCTKCSSLRIHTFISMSVCPSILRLIFYLFSYTATYLSVEDLRWSSLFHWKIPGGGPSLRTGTRQPDQDGQHSWYGEYLYAKENLFSSLSLCFPLPFSDFRWRLSSADSGCRRFCVVAWNWDVSLLCVFSG